MTGAVGDEVVLALLILALQPAQPGQICGPSPLRLISLAYETGKALGLDSIARAAVKRSAQLREPWWSAMLERVLLVSGAYFLVVHAPPLTTVGIGQIAIQLASVPPLLSLTTGCT
jgi:hypothetical protein